MVLQFLSYMELLGGLNLEAFIINSPSDWEPKFEFKFPEEGPNKLGIKRKLILSSFYIYLIASALTGL